MTTPRTPELFFDTVTLANFALAGRLDLLEHRYGQRAFVPVEVLDEVLEGVARGLAALAGIVAAVEEGSLSGTPAMSPDERRLYAELLRTLSPGEASCIARARQRGGVVASDDRAARAVAREHGVAVTGTIGILKAACLDGQLEPPDADAALEAMVRAGYYSPVGRISDLLE